MNIIIECPHCGRQFYTCMSYYPSELTGKLICNNCERSFYLKIEVKKWEEE